MTRRLIFCLLILSVSRPDAFAQKAGGGIGITSGFSYTGLSAAVTPEFFYRHHRLYAGPKLVIDDSYFPYKNTWGLLAGYGYDILQNEHWRAGVHAEYQAVWYKPYAYNNETAPSGNRAQEVNLGLDLFYHFLPQGRMYAGLHLGAGAFFETYHDVVTESHHINTGRTNMIRLSIGYKIFR